VNATARALLALSLALAARPAVAQERQIREARLPQRMEARLLDMVRDTATRRFLGDGYIGTDDVVRGGVVAMGGTLDVAGRIEGDLLVIDGHLRLEQSAAVSGDVTLIDAAVSGDAPGAVAGQVVAFAPASAPDLGDWADQGWRGRGWRDHGWRDHEWGRTGQWGSAQLGLRLGPTFNRIEGLPVWVGPELSSAGPDPTQLRAYLIWRTEPGPTRADRLGYHVTLQQFLAGRALSVGAGVESVIAPIEADGVSDLETSLASVLLHTDYRDYFQRQGWQVFTAWTPRSLPLSARLTYRQDDETARAPASPWTLTDHGQAWRLQPLVAEGRIRSLQLGAVLDTRSGQDPDRGDPDAQPFSVQHTELASGWYVRASISGGLGGTLAIPQRSDAMLVSAPALPGGAIAMLTASPVDNRFRAGWLDVRRYARIGRGSELALRGVVGGSLDGQTLPPQYQHALGGIGTLPGYDLFQADCGARAGIVTTGAAATEYYPSYGCDRVALLQAEYRGGMSLDFGWLRDGLDHWNDSRADWGWHGDQDWNVDLGWVVFFDAGQGWGFGRPDLPGHTTTDPLYDAGVGLTLGDVGFYWAAPLADGGGPSRFFIRLGYRF
jgi:hypothetical protein